MKKVEILNIFSLVTLAKLGPSGYIYANFSFSYYVSAISIIFVHLFFYFHANMIFFLTPFETHMLPLEGRCHNFCIFYQIWLKLDVETKSKPLVEEYHQNDSFKLLEFLVVAILRS